jgi:hypothetical protein
MLCDDTEYFTAAAGVTERAHIFHIATACTSCLATPITELRGEIATPPSVVLLDASYSNNRPRQAPKFISCMLLLFGPF